MIELFAIGVFIVHNLIVIWFDTNMPVHVLKLGYWFFHEEFPEEPMAMDWKGYVTIKWGLFGELITCPVCLSTHLSYITSTMILIMSTLPGLNATVLRVTSLQALVFVLVATTTWPGIITVLRRK